MRCAPAQFCAYESVAAHSSWLALRMSQGCLASRVPAPGPLSDSWNAHADAPAKPGQQMGGKHKVLFLSWLRRAGSTRGE